MTARRDSSDDAARTSRAANDEANDEGAVAEGRGRIFDRDSNIELAQPPPAQDGGGVAVGDTATPLEPPVDVRFVTSGICLSRFSQVQSVRAGGGGALAATTIARGR